MIVNFNTKNGHITKQSESGLGDVSITIEEAREAWNNVGTIEDCNLAFRRLAVDFNFDIQAALDFYKPIPAE